MESFFVRYVDAFATSDVDFLHRRLNQVTLDRYGADVTFGEADAAVERTLHRQYVEGEYTWFSDCGDPA